MTTLIKNVHIFDGRNDCGTGEIAFSEGVFLDKCSNPDEVIDGEGCFLMPGLIDSHIHTYSNIDYLAKASSYGVTTLLEMGNRDRKVSDINKSHKELANVLTCYSIAASPDSEICTRMNYPPEVIMHNPEEGREYVRRMVSWGADYIKIILEEPGVHFPEEIGRAICDEAHKNGKKTIAHTTSIESFRQGLKFGLDVMTHMPMTGDMPEDIVAAVKEQGITLVPTITMLENSAAKIHRVKPNAPVSRDISVANLHKFVKAGVRILAGTDATEGDKYPPAEVEYGISMLKEMQNQHEAGMSEIDCLRSATSESADFWGQSNIGVIEAGRRADILLVGGGILWRSLRIYTTLKLCGLKERK